jgi:hypothetical protein
MTAYTMTTSGDITDSSKWSGAALPPNPLIAGDTITINTGVAAALASGTVNWGSKPTTSTGAEITLAGTATLTIAAGAKLIMQAPYDITGGGVITVNGTLSHDCSGATNKSYLFRCGVTGTGKLVVGAGGTVTTEDPTYFWYQSSGVVQNAAQLDINGAAGSRALIQRMKNPASSIGWTTGLNYSAAGLFEASHCTFDACGDLSPVGSGAATYTFDYCTWINSTTGGGTQNLRIGGFGTPPTKVVTHCTFDKNTNSSGGWGTPTNITASENVFDGCWIASGNGGTNQTYNWNVKINNAATNPCHFYPAAGGSLVTHELLWHNISTSNPHWATPTGKSGARTVSGVVYAYEGTSQDGDCLLPQPTDATLQTFKDFTFLTNSDGGQPGTWQSQLGNAAVAYTLAWEHCVGPVASGAGTWGISVGETANAPTGRVTSVKSNVVYCTKGTITGHTLTQMQQSQTSNDPFVPSGLDYNNIFVSGITTPGATYDTLADSPATATQSLVGAAAHDTYLDPQHADQARRMPAWAAKFGAFLVANGQSASTAATAANARTLLLALHDGTYPTALTDNAIQRMIQWLERGTFTRNVTLRAAGHDSLTHGPYGAFLPTLSALTARATSATLTTTTSDGTAYWVITTSATTPDWDQVIAGQDWTGAAASQSGNVAVSGTTISITYTAAAGKYLHVAHVGAGTEAALDNYQKTSETISSSALPASGMSQTGRKLFTMMRRHRVAA